MSLATTVRNAVKTADKVTKKLQGDAILRAWNGQSGSGKTTWVDRTYKAIIEQKLHQRRLTDGRFAMSKGSVMILEKIDDLPGSVSDRINPVDGRDKIILPDGTEQSILDVLGLHDPAKNRPYFVEIVLGAETR